MATADPLVDTLVDLNPLPRLSIDFTKLEPPRSPSGETSIPDTADSGSSGGDAAEQRS